MRLLDIQHVAIRTDDLAATNDFYTDVLGMRLADRPAFNFPGSWLAMGETMIHIIAGDAALDDTGGFTPGSNAVDHIALGAQGFDSYRENFSKRGVAWKENDIPSFGLWQLFVKDPNGVTVELNFTAANEPEGSQGPGRETADMIRL